MLHKKSSGWSDGSNFQFSRVNCIPGPNNNALQASLSNFLSQLNGISSVSEKSKIIFTRDSLVRCKVHIRGSEQKLKFDLRISFEPRSNELWFNSNHSRKSGALLEVLGVIPGDHRNLRSFLESLWTIIEDDLSGSFTNRKICENLKFSLSLLSPNLLILKERLDKANKSFSILGRTCLLMAA